MASERLRLQQKEDSERAFEQQKALVSLQAKIGGKAEEARRLEVEKARKRDRAVGGISNYREQDDIEDYLVTSERKLKAGGVSEEEWSSIFASKLGGKVGSTWQDLCMEMGTYEEVKGGLLRQCGYTPKIAGDVFYGFKGESMKGMSADQLYHRGVQLLRRMVAPLKVPIDLEFAIVKPWVWAIMPRKARMLLDARVVSSPVELIGALQDYLVMEGERLEGQVAVFRKQGSSGESSSSSSGEKRIVGACFKCGKAGHKAIDCWQKGSGTGSGFGKNAISGGGAPARVIVCYICGEEGHKSTQCTKKKEKSAPKDSQPRQVRKISHREGKAILMKGKVNGREAEILIDSGASITVVPEGIVEPDLKTGGFVELTGFNSEAPLVTPLARVGFKIGHLEWEEEVALVPDIEGKKREVLYGIDLRSERGLQLVLMANEKRNDEVLRVTTRAEAREAEAERKEDERVVAREQPKVVSMSAVDTGTGRLGKGRPVADRPAGSPEPRPQVTETEDKREMVQGRQAEEEVLVGDPLPDGSRLEEASLAEECLVDEPSLAEEILVDEDEDVGEEWYCVRQGDKEVDLEIPPVKPGKGDRAELVRDVKADESLRAWRELADKEEQGFCWQDDLLYQARTTLTLELIHVMVIPKKFRERIMDLAHERSGHLGARKVKALVHQRFVWPGMARDIVEHCQSCKVCQMCKKTKARKVPLMEREILSEPFEVLAVDIVGPLPKGKGGFTHLLTAICMSSKWPEVIPLKSITARAVAAGLIDIFARTGIPLQLLSDQGSQFVGSLVAQLCRSLHIDKVKTAPYHPECNGVVERMHGTLGAMLTKASALGLDWVGQIPFALFALRSNPNKDTGFSPFQLVYGHRVRTPLDILHQGWAELSFEKLDTAEWADWLVSRLEVWHDVLRERGKEASRKRKVMFDRGAVERTLNVGDLVLCRVPGMSRKLKESWHGPYEVVGCMNRVDYKVKVGKGRSKILHINNLKRFHPRGEEVLRLAVVAEDWEGDEDIGTRLQEECEEFDRNVINELKQEFPEVFCDLPGKTKVVKLKIDTGDAEPVASHPHRVPDRLKKGVREEILKLVDLGIVVPSSSPWASPIVPLPKPDGTVRVCVDFRKVNDVTKGDPYYMVTLDEILERVGGSMIMSKLDLAKGFYQVEVEAQDREKTAFICPFGKFEFSRMPFGLKNAPALFQRCMEVVLHECYSFSAPYIDDVIIFSENAGEHVNHLRLVLKEIGRYGMTVKEEKCRFGMRKVEYLGHVIGGGELAVPEHRAAAMADYLLPKTKKQLRSFLGAVSYYRKFLKGHASKSAVLSPSTTKVAPSVVDWTEEMLETFKAIKVSLVNLCILTIPSQQDDFVLHTDASGAGIGATLNVTRDEEERPAAYYSKQLQGAQKRYSATELEGLAIYKSIHYFAHFLFGRHFKVVTDHKALVAFLHSRVLNRRLRGWLLELAQFDFEIIYRPGIENADADALSRQAWNIGEDAWRPAEEEEQNEQDLLRAAKSQLVGGDVGTSPTEGVNHSGLGVGHSGLGVSHSGLGVNHSGLGVNHLSN